MYFFSGGLPIKFPGQSSYNQAANIGEIHEGFGDRAMIFANAGSTGVSRRNLGLSRSEFRKQPTRTLKVKARATESKNRLVPR
jgi:hypothetical protein